MQHRIANRLLDSLTDAERPRWRGALEPVRMRRGQVLDGPGATSAHAWFPASATVSVLHALENGSSGEVALVGNEGVVGRSWPPGLGTSRCRALVCDEGEGFRVEADFVDAELGRAGSIGRAMLRFGEAMMAQTSQLVVCNRHHHIEQQLCRLLLSSLDRVGGRRLDMTHEWMATRLGVRREGVTAAARALRESGAISYRRGRIEVLDRDGLEACSCECHAVIAAEYERLLR